MRHRLMGFLFSLGWAILKFVPESFGRAIFKSIAGRVYRSNGRSVQQLRANLKQVTGASNDELDGLTSLGVNSYFKYWYEAFVLHTWSEKKINSRFIMINREKLAKLLAEEEKIILVLPHMGNWDAAAYWFTANYQPLTTVAERLKPIELYEKFVKFRNALGVEVLPLAKGTYQILRERLKTKRILALLADRDLSASGIKVNYFRAVTSMPAGPATLAWDEAAVLVPIKIFNPGDDRIFAEVQEVLRIDRTLDKEAAIEELTQKMATTFENMVQQNPTDWHLMQKVWSEVKPIKMG
jgi:lauroyl/myristoyl acyltransferase